ncbi:MAG: isochorismatase family protein, partial [Duncaniella sp.]|nr:isochorismatase family protein [Duncaniella sp.]
MKKMLLIIDPQVDFINGSLPVDEAPEAMDALAEYVKDSTDKYDAIAITADWHPADHHSFIDNGGEWPVHCVQDSAGAMIWDALLDATKASGLPVEVLHKGDRADVEEYSVFQNPRSCKRLTDLVKDLGITDIDVYYKNQTLPTKSLV